MSKATQSAENRRTEQFDSTGSNGINARITARIVVDQDGETHREYQVAGRSFGSVEAVQQLFGGNW